MYIHMYICIMYIYIYACIYSMCICMGICICSMCICMGICIYMHEHVCVCVIHELIFLVLSVPLLCTWYDNDVLMCIYIYEWYANDYIPENTVLAIYVLKYYQIYWTDNMCMILDNTSNNGEHIITDEYTYIHTYAIIYCTCLIKQWMA